MKTRDQVKKVAIRLIKSEGLINLSRWELCASAEIPDGSFASIMECSFTEFVAELEAEAHPENPHTVERNRVAPGFRRLQILSTALNLAAHVGYDNITREDVAEAAGVSGSLIYWHFGSVDELKKSVLRAAIDQECLSVIAEGIVNKAPAALAAPRRLQLKAMRSIAGGL